MTRPAALLSLAAVGAAFVLAPAFAGPAKGKPRVKTTKRAIESLAVDGPIVAYDLQAGEG